MDYTNSEATKEDMKVGRDLQDTLKHEIDRLNGIII